MFYTLSDDRAEVCLMHGPCVSTRTLSARLEPDGSIRLCLVFPDSHRPESATIEPTETTVRAAGPRARTVDLEYGHAQDRHLRLLIAMHVDALAYERNAL